MTETCVVCGKEYPEMGIHCEPCFHKGVKEGTIVCFPSFFFTKEELKKRGEL